jgi:hypothetical protein
MGLLVTSGITGWLLADSNAPWWVGAVVLLAVSVVYASAVVIFFVFWRRRHGL